MSLFSLLNGTSQSSTASTSSTMSTLLAQIQAKGAASAASTDKTTTGSTKGSVNITVDAQRASAEASDAKKDASALVAELRKAFDAAYKEGDTPDTRELSGRSLALVALNQDGGFSRAEVAAAKAELRGRDRSSALAMLKSGDLTSATLITYNKQLVAERASMSNEERALREVNPKLR